MSWQTEDGRQVDENEIVRQDQTGKPVVHFPGEGWLKVVDNGSKSDPVSIPSPITPPVTETKSFLLRVGGDELAREEVAEPETLPLLGRAGYIGVGMSTIISAYPKSGKTTLLAALLHEWASAGHRILVLTEEPRLAWVLRINDEPDVWRNVTFVFALGAGKDAAHAAAFAGPEDVVVIDTLRNVLGFQDENDNSEIARTINPFIATARDTGKTFIALHHENKEGGAHGRGITGGHALFAAFDTGLEVLRVPESEKRRKIRCLARMLNSPDFLYELREGNLVALGESTAVEAHEVRQHILAALTDEPMSTVKIREALEEPLPSLTQVKYALTDLLNAGEIERTGAGKRGDPYRWRALVSIQSPTLLIGDRNESESP